MVTSLFTRRRLPDVSLSSNPSNPDYQQTYGSKYIPSPWTNRGRSLGWPDSLPACRARWTPESIEGNGSYLTWGDVSGNGYHATGTLPTIGAGIGGRPSVVGHASSNSRMEIQPRDLMNGLQDWAMFAVMKTPATGQNLQSLLGSSSFGGTTTNMFNLELTGGYPSTLQMRTQWGDDAANAEKDCVFASNAMAASTWYSVLVNAVFSGTFMQGYLNGASSGSGINFGGARDRLYHAAAFYLMGTNYVSDFWWKGECCEIALFPRSLSSQQRTDLFAYSLASYGV